MRAGISLDFIKNGTTSSLGDSTIMYYGPNDKAVPDSVLVCTLWVLLIIMCVSVVSTYIYTCT